MSASINNRLTNAGNALFSLAGNIYERAAFEDTLVTEVFHANTLGGLGCLPPIAEQIVETFMESKDYTVNVFKVLKHYFTKTNLSDLTEDESQRAWYQLFADAFSGMSPSLPTANSNGTGAEEQNYNSGNKFHIGHKVTSEMKFPTLHGNFGGATTFVSQVKGLLEHFQYNPGEYFTIFLGHCKGHAFKTVMHMKPMLGDDFQKHANYFIEYYDKRDMDKDKKYTNFMAKVHQQYNESTQLFCQCFDENSAELIEAGLLILFSTDPEGHKRQQADLFISKITSNIRDYVHEQMIKAHKPLAKCDIKEIYAWAILAEAKNKIPMKQSDTSANFTPKDDSKYQERRCYYCDKKGHNYQYKDRSGRMQKICRAAINGEEPCENFKKYVKAKYNVDWKPK
mmetsp:Transcript_14473/g.19010  ORF Transcript_14473/g.19010 Transcript_14473/m.19010 type:complete len:396 (+) Transcript_14473:439-1626(+)